MDPSPSSIPVHRPLQAPAGDGDRVLADIIARFRDAERGIAPPKTLGPAILAARREQYIDNSVALDDALIEIVVAAMTTMKVLRANTPEIIARHDRRH